VLLLQRQMPRGAEGVVGKRSQNKHERERERSGNSRPRVKGKRKNLRDGREKAGERLPVLTGKRLCLLLLLLLRVLGVVRWNKNALVRPKRRRPKSSRSLHVRACECMASRLGKKSAAGQAPKR
jgi:hypothetical protein